MKHSRKLLTTLRVVGDSIAIVASWLLAGYLRFYIIPGGRAPSFGQFVQLSAVVWAFNIFFLSRAGLYVDELDHSWRKETTKLVSSAFNAYLLLVVVLYFVYANKVSRIAIGMYFFLVVIFLVAERTLISAFIKRCYHRGRFTRESSCWV